MKADFTAEDARTMAKVYGSGRVYDMLNNLAERIEADDAMVDRACTAYRLLMDHEDGPSELAMRAALLAVWPNPPAQAAQVDAWQIVCDAIRKHQFSDENRRVRLTVDVETLLREINSQKDAEPVAQGEVVDIDTVALRAAEEISLMWGQDRSQFVAKIQVRIIAAMRKIRPFQPRAVPDARAMAYHFMGWRLPDDFAPDCGVSFDGRKNDEWNKNKTWPVGTNLFTVDQAEQMFRYVLAAAPSPGESRP